MACEPVITMPATSRGIGQDLPGPGVDRDGGRTGALQAGRNPLVEVAQALADVFVGFAELDDEQGAGIGLAGGGGGLHAADSKAWTSPGSGAKKKPVQWTGL